jgi:hypothetical protein
MPKKLLSLTNSVGFWVSFSDPSQRAEDGAVGGGGHLAADVIAIADAREESRIGRTGSRKAECHAERGQGGKLRQGRFKGFHVFILRKN